jgi:broad specificity phosphatase PhoE
MTSLLLIRHAQSQHHVRGFVGGWSDWPLSALGRQQACALAARLRDEYGGVPGVLACSDLARAAQTAEAIGQALGVVPRPMPELREHSCGLVDGMRQEDAEQHTIPATEPLIDWAAYPGAETWRQVYARAIPCIERLIGGESDLRIVVSHKIPIHLILCWWLGIAHDGASKAWFDTDPASITALRAEPWGGHTVLRVNDTAHLRAEHVREIREE